MQTFFAEIFFTIYLEIKTKQLYFAPMRINHPFNIVLVNFPNGLSRSRNCRSTIVPKNRQPFKSLVKPYNDNYTKSDYATMSSNSLKVTTKPVSYSKISCARYFDKCESVLVGAIVVNFVVLVASILFLL